VDIHTAVERLDQPLIAGDLGRDTHLDGRVVRLHRERFFETYAGLRRWHRSLPEGVIETRTAIGVPHPTRAARGDPMKFDSDVKMLQKALGAVVRIVPNRTTMTILGHVLVRAEKSGLTLTATDLEVGVRTSIPAEVAKTGATTVPAKLLAGVVGELNEDSVSFALKDDRLRISAGRSNTTLATTAADEFPPGPQPADGEPIRLPGEELLTAIGQVRPAVSTDEARAVLTGVLVRLDGERLTLATTDGHRLVERRMDGVKSTPETAIVPVKALVELSRAFKDETGDIEMQFALGRAHPSPATSPASARRRRRRRLRAHAQPAQHRPGCGA
jgi:hypothetical protein